MSLTFRPTGFVAAAVVASCLCFLAACDGGNSTTSAGGGGTSTTSTVAARAVTPMGTILAVHFGGVDSVTHLNEGEPHIAYRDNATSNGWAGFGYAIPRGDPTCCNGETYGISEAWMQTPAGPVVVRAQAHPARRPAFGDFEASAWSMRAQDATGSWSGAFARGSANRGNEVDDQEAGGKTVPQLMTVGDQNPQMFACAGGRSNDRAVRTTLLFEVKPPTGSPLAGGGTRLIQDLLSGDDRPSPPNRDPLTGIPGRPATPPTPTITNRPGNPITEGFVQCAMTQNGDDVATRELHMLTVANGHLLHSVASNFSTATTGAVSFQRFNTVSLWEDVTQALGVNFGTIVSAAIAASRPTAVSVFFVAQGSDGRYRLYHTVRFSNGSWRPADDILAINGTLNGTNYAFNVAAGMCPVIGQPQKSELVYVIYDVGTVIEVGRVVSQAQQWPGGIQGIYSPLENISGLWSGITDPANAWNIHNVFVSSRPFRE